MRASSIAFLKALVNAVNEATKVIHKFLFIPFAYRLIMCTVFSVARRAVKEGRPRTLRGFKHLIATIE